MWWQHAQKPDFVFRAKRTNLFKSALGGGSVQSITGSRGVRISGSNAGYTMYRGSLKSTGYLLHSPVSLSLLLPVRRLVPLYFSWSRPLSSFSPGYWLSVLTDKEAGFVPEPIWTLRGSQKSIFLAGNRIMISRFEKSVARHFTDCTIASPKSDFCRFSKHYQLYPFYHSF